MENKITRESFMKEFAGILNMLKEHEFLMYSDKDEFERKRKTAYEAFVRLLKNKTGMDLPVQPQAVNLYGVKTASIDSAKRVLRTACRYYKTKAGETNDSDVRVKFEAYAEACDKATPLL
jgi:hypothetical protein